MRKKLKPCFIIAEAGVNHNGSFTIAKKMVAVAAEAGADAIKFQTFTAKNLVIKNAPKAEYQRQNTPSSESQYEMIKKLELDFDVYRKLKVYCESKNIIFLSSPFDLESVDFLYKLGLKLFKIPSGEITNLPYLRKVGSLNRKIIMSTGMANMREIKEAIGVLRKVGIRKNNIILLQCNTEYPTPMRDVNLRAMLTLRDKFKVVVGFSDHTWGIEVPIAAVALGAKVIEKHFTLDKGMKGPDHKASLEPHELNQMVKSIRNIEMALGNGIKRPSESEMKNITIARKSLVALRKIKRGEVFSEENLTVKRPGAGLSPMKWDFVIGRLATRNYKKDELIDKPNY